MQSSNQPGKISLPFANSGQKQPIPVNSQIGIEDGRASYTDGFPPLTRTPLAAGGKPPFGTDMNGILNAVTAIQQWQSAGGLFKFDSAFAAAISGYPKGAILAKADGSGAWRNTVEANTTNPDTGGAGWVDDSAGGLINVQVFKASGTYTPTPGTTSVIVEAVGGGGAGGGIQAAPSAVTAGPGGGGGGYGRRRITSGFSGVAVTIGAGGTGISGSGAGGNGVASSFGTLLVASGGAGGGSATTTTTNVITSGVSGLGGSATSADILRPGSQGGSALIGGSFALAGAGGASFFGSGAPYGSITGPSVSPGSPAEANTGGGGSGAVGFNNASAAAGGNGGSGIVIVYEYK